MTSIPEGRPVITAGLFFGDEGKGATVDYLTRVRAPGLVVRYNGGPQAAHHVLTPDGRRHCFSQFGSGTFTDGTLTLLSRNVIVDLPALVLEEEALKRQGVLDTAERLTIEDDCPVITPWHVIMNRMQEESRGEERHGSCGRGVAQAWKDSLTEAGIRVRDIFDNNKLLRKLKYLRLAKIDLAEQWIADAPAPVPLLHERLRQLKAFSAEEAASLLQGAAQKTAFHIVSREGALELLSRHPHAVFEGAQGVLLDKDFGFFPHVTPSTTTFHPAVALAREAGLPEPYRLGVLRAYITRHGPGPLPSEDTTLASMLPDLDNTNDQWQGPVRAGWLDLPLLRYAALLCDGMDGVAVTCLDRIRSLPEIRISQGYSARAESLFNRVDESGLLSAIAEAAGAPVVLTSDRADASGRRLC